MTVNVYYCRMTAPTRSRRRGAVLEQALCLAAVAEMTAVGYAGMTMEGVAARARTGKAAVYRRWPNKHALALDAIRYVMPPLPELDANAPARENLRRIFTALCGVFAGDSAFPGLALAVGVLGDPQMRAAFVEVVVAPRLAVVTGILNDAQRNGEVGALTPLAPQVGPALIIQAFLINGAPPSTQDIELILDTVLPATACG